VLLPYYVGTAGILVDCDRPETLDIRAMKNNLPLMVFVTRPCDLVFVDQLRSLHSNPLDNRELMAL
jgi:hypothetical protein